MKKKNRNNISLEKPGVEGQRPSPPEAKRRRRRKSSYQLKWEEFYKNWDFPPDGINENTSGAPFLEGREGDGLRSRNSGEAYATPMDTGNESQWRKNSTNKP